MQHQIKLIGLTALFILISGCAKSIAPGAGGGDIFQPVRSFAMADGNFGTIEFSEMPSSSKTGWFRLSFHDSLDPSSRNLVRLDTNPSVAVNMNCCGRPLNDVKTTRENDGQYIVEGANWDGGLWDVRIFIDDKLVELFSVNVD